MPRSKVESICVEDGKTEQWTTTAGEKAVKEWCERQQREDGRESGDMGCDMKPDVAAARLGLKHIAGFVLIQSAIAVHGGGGGDIGKSAAAWIERDLGTMRRAGTSVLIVKESEERVSCSLGRKVGPDHTKHGLCSRRNLGTFWEIWT